uniref:Uncharacterized protein n=1 Tax=Octopus bimaculoides TaxID=37653 RepID=A0A0L8G6B7_OCTBM
MPPPPPLRLRPMANITHLLQPTLLMLLLTVPLWCLATYRLLRTASLLMVVQQLVLVNYSLSLSFPSFFVS